MVTFKESLNRRDAMDLEANPEEMETVKERQELCEHVSVSSVSELLLCSVLNNPDQSGRLDSSSGLL
jgi:hypothetical protein